MLERVILTLCLGALCGCGGSSSSSTGGSGGGNPYEPGPLVDNTQWVPTTAGDDILGSPPADEECGLIPIDCPEYPWPEDECVTFDATSTCITAFVPECLQGLTVLSVYTRMPDTRLTLCNWLTLEQPSLRNIRAGDQVEVRARHSALTAPVSGEARMTFVLGDEILFDYSVLIPSDFVFPSVTWTATKDYPAGTPMLWHVDNHGSNEYMLIEVNVL
jgi:hypothetical protein